MRQELSWTDMLMVTAVFLTVIAILATVAAVL